MDGREIETVCCMCGDVGFPDKLFRCSTCRNRFQHTYCSNYYGEYADLNEICDWCQRDGTEHGAGNSSSPSPARKHADGRGSTAEKGATGKAPSPRTPTRRYKLLKDVMC